MKCLEDVAAGRDWDGAELEELMDALAVFGKYTARYDHQVAVVVGGETGRDECAGLRCGFDEKRGATDASDQAVALWEGPIGRAEVWFEFR